MECVPTKGPKAGNKCIFPYTKNGKTCYGPRCCNLDNDPKGAWCSTRVDDNGVHIKENYVYCKGSPCEGTRFLISNYQGHLQLIPNTFIQLS